MRIFEGILKSGVDLYDSGQGFWSRFIPSREGTSLHEKMHGSHLRKLQGDKFKLAHYESGFYKRALRRWLDPLARDALMLDLGAGDGRFTELLLDMGFSQIVSTDISRENLVSLGQYLDEVGGRDKVALIQSDASDPIFREATFDCILCIGVLYYLGNDYFDGKAQVSGILKENGYLIESEPDLEGQALKALIFDGLESFIDVTKNRRFIESYGGQDFHLRLFDRQEMLENFAKYGFELVDRHGLSLFPLLMIVAKARGLIKENEIEEHHDQIQRCFDYFDGEGDTYKHIIWLARKVASDHVSR